MSGFVGDLSPSQEENLRKFREEAERIPDKPEEDDQYYLRWLRAKNFNLEQALEMLRNHVKWRKELDVDSVLEWTPPEVLQKYLPGSFFGEDKEGHPVFYDFLGNADVVGLCLSVTPEDGLRNQIRNCEIAGNLFKEQSQKHGREIGTVTIIENMENLSYHRQYYGPAIHQIRKVFTTFGRNYPERTNIVFIINAPRIFPIIFNFYKRFIDENTRKKIQILGSNWKEVLQEYISPDQLPQAYGGLRCDPDPECSQYINWGGEVPEDYYLMNKIIKKKEDMTRVIVARNSSHQVEVNVTSESVIRWELLTMDHDIGFGVFYKSHQPEAEQQTILPVKRRQSHVIPVTGFYHCQENGTYLLHFDNSYSWLRQKEVFYFVRVDEPDTSISIPPMVAAENNHHISSPSTGADNGVNTFSERGLEPSTSTND